MAKKTRKVLKQASQQRAIQQAAANITTAAAAATTAETTVQKSTPTASRMVKPAERAPEDYRYVKADLRRIGVLAVSFTAILIALSFFIH